MFLMNKLKGFLKMQNSMNQTEKSLEAKTLKWMERLEKRRKQTQIMDKKAKDSLVNVDSYISDCKHFLSKKDFIRAFEAMVYAFGIYETLINLELVKEV